ncbi:hypothetical protein, partial [Klebsiella aerogenes]|uniref:hypothetical protein n=1 Tax=Klebsiella aerogenes TaxID=548 RepID=UPI001954B4ED
FGGHQATHNASCCVSEIAAVTPGHREAMSPESITTTGRMDSGPAPVGASRNDGLVGMLTGALPAY